MIVLDICIIDIFIAIVINELLPVYILRIMTSKTISSPRLGFRTMAVTKFSSFFFYKRPLKEFGRLQSNTPRNQLSLRLETEIV